uniref:Uncharacterized protein n=1 Tax=Noccaea caerulescens TaxID=107243 RepID=A0A1J3GFP7_NOCCA
MIKIRINLYYICSKLEVRSGVFVDVNMRDDFEQKPKKKKTKFLQVGIDREKGEIKILRFVFFFFYFKERETDKSKFCFFCLFIIVSIM